MRLSSKTVVIFAASLALAAGFAHGQPYPGGGYVAPQFQPPYQAPYAPQPNQAPVNDSNGAMQGFRGELNGVSDLAARTGSQSHAGQSQPAPVMPPPDPYATGAYPQYPQGAQPPYGYPLQPNPQIYPPSR